MITFKNNKAVINGKEYDIYGRLICLPLGKKYSVEQIDRIGIEQFEKNVQSLKEKSEKFISDLKINGLSYENGNIIRKAIKSYDVDKESILYDDFGAEGQLEKEIVYSSTDKSIGACCDWFYEFYKKQLPTSLP